MFKSEEFSKKGRGLKIVSLSADLIVVGGGLAGVCASISAAREGMTVILVQDRPVLGGNASSEVRVWALGATSHQGNNNRYAREGGVIDEIMVENLMRNPEGNPVIFDTVLIDKVKAERNITLLLNTSMISVCKSGGRAIASVEAFNASSQILYGISAPLFCDASGDGILSYLAGASYRIGAEDSSEFNEKYAPDEEYGQLLGHSILFYAKDVGHPVEYKAPDFALKNINKIPRCEMIQSEEFGCSYWWLEYGAEKDTVYDNESIKYELWKVVYGVWDHIKNSGHYKNVNNLTLEWVGLIPGKRESRRFNGLYMLNQNDVIGQTDFKDAVAYGGWAIDIHPAKGVYSPLSPCAQYHSKGIYSIPYRCMVSRDIDNLFLAGRILSASHVAFGSVRVMMTLAHCAQAVGVASSLCKRHGVAPKDIVDNKLIIELRDRLALCGQGIPFCPIRKESNLASDAVLTASSEYSLSRLVPGEGWRSLDAPVAQLLPLRAETAYRFTFEIESDSSRELGVSLLVSSKIQNYTPDVLVAKNVLRLSPGINTYKVDFSECLDVDRYAFVAFDMAEGVRVRESDVRLSGIMTVYNKYNKSVAKNTAQMAPENSGIESFDFWIPERRPGGKNLAFGVSPALDFFACENVLNGYVRPFILPNVWMAALEDKFPELTLKWQTKMTVRGINLYFDTDYDHSMECVQKHHPERVIPFCVRNYSVSDIDGKVLFCGFGNYQTINSIRFDVPVSVEGLVLRFERTCDNIPVPLFQIVVF